MRKLLPFLLFSAVASGQITFSPPAGSYAGTQNVTVNCPSGKKCFYTIDGSKPSIAGFLYSTPLTISATQTINVIAAQVPVMSRDNGTAPSGTSSNPSGAGTWKCSTFSGTDFSPPSNANCQAAGSGGGVGTIEPSNLIWSFGSPMIETLSTTSSTGTTQALFIRPVNFSNCNDCTELVQDKIVQVDKGKTFLLNNEMDLNVNMLNVYNQFHTASLQCNQQGATPRWQYDNQQTPWRDFPGPVTFGCPISTTQQTEIRYGMHWTNGDTSCSDSSGSGYSTDSYDFLTVCVGGTNGTGGTCHNFTFSGLTLCGFHKGFPEEMNQQDQPDLTNTTTSGSNPTTATRKVWNNNGSLAYYGTEVTASATYNIGPLLPIPPMRTGGMLHLGGQISIH